MNNNNSEKTKFQVNKNHISLQKLGNSSIANLKAGSLFRKISLISHRLKITIAITSSNQVVVIKITNEIIGNLKLAIQDIKNLNNKWVPNITPLKSL